MDDNQFWATIWGCVTAVVISVVATIGGCTAYEDHLIGEAIKAGADPIDARCGVAGTSNSGKEQCLIRAAGKKP